MLSKTILITGATSGIGSETALALAKQGHVIYLLVRNPAKAEELKDKIISQTGNKKIFIIACDLADMNSVCLAADEIKTKLVNIQVLINNAGGIFAKREVTADGFEMTFAVNHLGHFLLTLKLMPLLEKGQARIINVSSEAHKAAKVNFADLQYKKKYSGFRAYANAKLFNIFFSKSLAERYANKGITSFSVHPGLVKSGFGASYTGFFKILLLLMRPFMVSAKMGARTSVYLAGSLPRIESYTGKYFINKRVGKISDLADSKLRQDLWLASETLIKKYL